ncbi:MAG: hypothetical protein SchgKO_07990 [Schleiferiaceae bacterium]
MFTFEFSKSITPFSMRYLAFFLLSVVIISCSPSDGEVSELVEAIPMTSPVIVRVNDLDNAIDSWETSEVTQSLDTLSGFSQFMQQVEGIRNWISQAGVEGKEPIWLAAQLSGAKEYQWMWVLRDPSEGGMISLLPEATEVRVYSKVSIVSFQYKENTWYAASSRGVVMASPAQSLIEAGIRQLQSEFSMLQNNFFITIEKTANRKDLFNVFIQNQQFPDLLKTTFPQTRPDWIEVSSPWVGLDATVEANQMILNGLALHPDTFGGYLSVFSDLSKGNFEAPSILPNHVALWVGMSIEDGEDFYDARVQFLKKWKKHRSQQLGLGDLGINPNVDIYPFIDNEMGVFYLQNGQSDLAQTKIGYIKCNGVDDRNALIEFLSDPTPENYRDHLIYPASQKGAFPLIFGRLFKGFDKPYLVSMGSYVLFADNPLSLKSAINDISAGKTLSQNPQFEQYMAQYPSSGHLFALAKNPEALSLLDKILSPEATAEAKSKNKSLEKISWAGIHLVNKSEVSYLQSIITYQEERKEEARQMWSMRLESPMIGKPHLVKNHYTQKNEILVQDNNYVVYLIDGKGKILWTKALEEAILGEVHQVDLYKNNKLQLVFNTKKRLWVLDRLGRDVENFPIILPTQSTAPMAVFDYDRTRNYRFIVPSGGNLFNYNKDGEAVSGWVFEAMSSDIKHAPEHFSVNGRDFILVSASDGNVKFIDRRGQSRVDLGGKIPLSENPWFYVNKDQQPRVVTVSDNATLVSVFLNGTLDETDLGFDETEKITFSYDGQSYVFLEGPTLAVRDELSPFSIELEGTPVAGPYSFTSKGKKVYAVTTESPDRVYLVNHEGKVVDGFPIFGNTAVTLGPLNQKSVPVLLVGTGDGTLMAYSIR